MNGTPAKPRSRLVCAVMVALLIPLGLVTRKYAAQIPARVGEYLPDALWAAMVYWIFAFLLPRRSMRTLALTALVFSYCIEISQLYHAPWIDRIRANRLGGLVLGYGFLWSDLLCYTAGVVVAAIIDLGFDRMRQLRN